MTGNRISAVGSDDEIETLVGDGTRVIDLDGRTGIPGLIDNHNHLIFNAPTWPNGVRLGRVRTRAVALERIAEKAAELGSGDGPRAHRFRHRRLEPGSVYRRPA